MAGNGMNEIGQLRVKISQIVNLLAELRFINLVSNSSFQNHDQEN